MASHALVRSILADIRRRAAARSPKESKVSTTIPQRISTQRIYNTNRALDSNVATGPRINLQALWVAKAAPKDIFTRLWQASPKPKLLSSRRHPVALHLAKLSYSASYRKWTGLMLLTGEKLIREHCQRHGPCLRIYTTTHTNELLHDPGITFHKVVAANRRILELVGSLRCFKNGLVAEVPIAKQTEIQGLKFVVCIGTKQGSSERLGTVLRTAQAFGWDGVWILENGAIDLLDPRTIRASQVRSRLSLVQHPELLGNTTIQSGQSRRCHCLCRSTGTPNRNHRTHQL
ncbi:hypothetical protein BdWA1_001265 [Babesia duncani]|uniref:Uncharacterized protein n=1 Tax=Babesia duncani TaxID=323732 RepID=A0AAD9PNT8_9APIC|nr:hypothetical protein BdWA1_001265 [Babesia duncani]